MSRLPPNTIVATDRRALHEGTGVASYATAVLAAVRTMEVRPAAILAERPARDGALGRIAKWGRAIWPGSRRLGWRAGPLPQLHGQDIFRIAQVHFDLHGRLLRLRAPEPAGIVHWSYPVPLLIEGWRNLYTIHDLIPLHQPDLTPIDGARHRRLLARIVAGADAIVTVSPTVRDEIAAAFGEGVRVVDCGEAVMPEAAPADRGPRDYLLVCGSIEPRKNIERIVAAYAASGVAMPLLIAGPLGWQGAAIRDRIGRVAGVRWLPYQPRDALIALISGARALLMPSLAEGFGLPVAEAMALGTPVVTSADGAMAETAGGAALLVDPRDEQAIAGAIRAIACDDRLWSARASAGLERAVAFAPQRFADRLEAVYAGCLASFPPPAYPAG